MFQQIIMHTPLWVWAMLAFLIHRGWSAIFDREVPIAKVAVIPLLMLVLSLYGLYGQAQVNGLGLGLGLVLGVALAAALVSAVLSWIAVGSAGIVPHPEQGTVFLRGSRVPLLMMLSVFALKYVTGVLQAMHSPHVQGALFALLISMVYGVFIGVSAGRMLRILHVYRRAQLPLAQAAG